jgi:hypothetical protein
MIEDSVLYNNSMGWVPEADRTGPGREAKWKRQRQAHSGIEDLSLA